MVTRTKPRPLPDLGVGAAVGGSSQPPLRKSLLPILLETLNIERNDPSADAAKAMIESVVGHCARGLLMGERLSLPPHTIAALEPIANQASALAELLDHSSLAQPVVRGLGIDRDQIFALRSSLEHLAGNAYREIERYRKIPSSKGEHNAMYAKALKDALHMLDALFEKLRVDHADSDPNERDADKREFIRLCRGRLPAAPAHRAGAKKTKTKRAK